MDNQELHDTLDDVVSSMKSGEPVSGLHYVVVAEGDENTEVVAGGRNVDLRIVLLTVLKAMKDRDGHTKMLKSVMQVLSKMDGGIGSDILDGNMDKLPPELRDAMIGCIDAVIKIRRQERRDDDDAVLPPQHPPRQ